MKKILVIDDDLTDLRIIDKNISSHNYEVITAATPQDGLNKAKEIKPDLIILDIIMPDIDGAEVYSLLKKEPETHNIPVIFLTAALDKEKNEQVLGPDIEEDFFNIIAKPFNEKEVIDRIKSIIGE
ncbi:MAG: response regulator [Candidatus Omnitrophica bacterium]|nr:response regulator [Candidatus Omnitrophota bacterium]